MFCVGGQLENQSLLLRGSVCNHLQLNWDIGGRARPVSLSARITCMEGQRQASSNSFFLPPAHSRLYGMLQPSYTYMWYIFDYVVFFVIGPLHYWTSNMVHSGSCPSSSQLTMQLGDGLPFQEKKSLGSQVRNWTLGSCQSQSQLANDVVLRSYRVMTKSLGPSQVYKRWKASQRATEPVNTFNNRSGFTSVRCEPVEF